MATRNVSLIVSQLEDAHKKSLISLLSVGGKASVAKVEGDYFILLIGGTVSSGVHIVTDNIRDDLTKMKLVKMDDMSIKLTKLGWSVVNIIAVERELSGRYE